MLRNWQLLPARNVAERTDAASALDKAFIRNKTYESLIAAG